MKKLKEKQKKIIFAGIAIIVFVVILGILILCLSKKEKDKPNNITTNEIPNQVSPEEAENMYSNLTEKCTGALVWDIKLGDTVEIDNLDNANACQNENYYSKMNGYTYDEEGNVILHVNVLKRIENNLYKLDDTLVGEFNEEKINESLDYGTTYAYTYAKSDEKYKLIKVELMTPAPDDTSVTE